MTGTGRPLRFLVLVIGCWAGGRMVMLWPVIPVTPAEQAAEQVVGQAGRPSAVVAAKVVAVSRADVPALRAARCPAAFGARPLPARSASPRIGAPFVPAIIASLPAPPQLEPGITPRPGLVAGLPTAASLRSTRRSRLFGSAWMLARGGNGTVGIAGAQLGGSQAGLRLAYAVREDRRLAFAVRASSPLGAGLRELALGMEWQPTRLPVRLVAEQRFALNRGRGGPTLMAVGGVGPVPIAAGFDLEGYAQGGVIARDGAEGFADGAVRLARPVATLGDIRLDLGGGGWGAAQRGAARLDIGPSLSARVPIGAQPVRLSLDWRQRVAGNAAPGSGLVLTLGADF